MSELSDMFADQFKRWLIHNGKGNLYSDYLSSSKIIDSTFLNEIKEQSVFEVTNLQTIEKIRKNIQQSRRTNMKYIEFLDEYVRFLIEQEHSSGNSGEGVPFSDCQNSENMSVENNYPTRSWREVVKQFIDDELKDCREEYDRIFDESDDKLFYERIYRNREFKTVLNSFAEAFEKTAESFFFNSDLWDDDTEEFKNIINGFLANNNHTSEEVNLLYQEVSAVLDKKIARIKEIWDLAIDDDDEENYKSIRRQRKLLKSIKQEIDNLYQIAEKYYILKSGNNKSVEEHKSLKDLKHAEQLEAAEEKNVSAESNSFIDELVSNIQQTEPIEAHRNITDIISPSLDESQEKRMQSERLIENSRFDQSEPSHQEMNMTAVEEAEVGDFEENVTEELTENVPPNLKINGNDILVYDWCDVTRRVCEYAINAKPFVMATIRDKSVVIKGMAAFGRSNLNSLLNPAYIRLSNGLKVLGNDDRESCKTICKAVCEHCGLRDTIEIK